MAKARALDKHRKSISSIRKITRTMELIANTRFKRTMNRDTAATAYTTLITRLVNDLFQSGLEVTHPLLEDRPEPRRAVLLILSGNRGMCGGYNMSIMRLAIGRYQKLWEEVPEVRTEIAGKRGIGVLKQAGVIPDRPYTHFGDVPQYDDVDALATRYLDEFISRKIDRIDVAYTKFINSARQDPVVETLLPLGAAAQWANASTESPEERNQKPEEVEYEFLPSAESILEDLVPTSFRAKLYKCFLDAAVSEHISRMVAMKAATENADEMIRQLSMSYNRARQSQITNEMMEVIGGAEALQ